MNDGARDLCALVVSAMEANEGQTMSNGILI